MLQRIAESLFIALQRALPARLLGRGVHAVTRSRNFLVKTLLIRALSALRRERERSGTARPGGYDSFNAFFTRTLKPGSRPIDPDPATIVSPADGTIQQTRSDCGRRNPAGERHRLQRGQRCSVAGQRRPHGIAMDRSSRSTSHPGTTIACTCPLRARIVRMTHVPGELWSVNATTAARVAWPVRAQ